MIAPEYTDPPAPCLCARIPVRRGLARILGEVRIMRAERGILRSMPARLLLLVVRRNPLALRPGPCPDYFYRASARDLVPERLALFCTP